MARRETPREEKVGEAGPVEDERRQGRRRKGSAAVGGHQPDPDGGPGRAVRGLTHFSTFSGIGGLDLGLERAGWQTLAFSEIDPYASAVLAHHWPDIPNLGDITHLVGAGSKGAQKGREASGRQQDGQDPDSRPAEGRGGDAAWKSATLWSGGFP